MYYPGHGATGKDYRVNGVPVGAYVESGLISDKTQITKAINSIVPAGGTPMRQALYESVKLIINDPEVKNRNGAVRAIILLTDGKWNTGGDPQGIDRISFGGPLSYTELEKDPKIADGQGSVITWAKNNNIKIYTVALNGIDPDQPDQQKLRDYAYETGGTPYVANSVKDLEGIYMLIAGKLKEEASVDTQVALDFTTMEVNGNATILGRDAFQYEFLPPDRSTFIVPPSPAHTVIADNTTDWAKGQLTFSAGTIKVNQEWMVNFTLKALKEGNIKVLSSKSSKVTFNGTEGEVGIPDTYITAVPPGTEKGPEGITFDIIHLQRTNKPSDTQIAMLTWEPVYNGFDNMINWKIWLAPPYSNSFGWVENFTLERGYNPVPYNLVIRNLTPGTYTVKVEGQVGDANEANKTLSLTIPEPTVITQILIGAPPPS